MTRKILVIDAHPDPERRRFCHALSEAYINAAQDAGKQTRLITLAETPVEMLRTATDFAAAPTDKAILSARDDILWADHVVIVFPLWMGGAPALLHAFLEQIARANFFAQTEGRGIRPRFKGKSARLIVTMGMPAFIYRLYFRAHGVRALMQGVLGFAGFAPVRASYFGAIEAASAETQAARLARVRQWGAEGR